MHRCQGQRTHGPPPDELKTGDIVEIITTKGHHPSKDWLNFVKTGKARTRIRQWIKTQEKDRSLTLGREMCEKEFRKHKLNFNELVNTQEMERRRRNSTSKPSMTLIANVGTEKSRRCS